MCVREPREDEEESFALKRKISWVPSLPEGESSLCGIKYVCIYENINNMLKVSRTPCPISCLLMNNAENT